MDLSCLCLTFLCRGRKFFYIQLNIKTLARIPWTQVLATLIHLDPYICCPQHKENLKWWSRFGVGWFYLYTLESSAIISDTWHVIIPKYFGFLHRPKVIVYFWNTQSLFSLSEQTFIIREHLKITTFLARIVAPWRDHRCSPTLKIF